MESEKRFYKKHGVLKVFDEPTYVRDMEKLLARYAKKLLGDEKQRFRCDYENCKRVLFSDKTSPFKCTACGHGTMRLAPPKTYCCECGQPIYFNISKNLEVLCDKCTAQKVKEVADLECDCGRQIQEKRRKARKGETIEGKKESLGTIRNAEDYRFALDLREKKEYLEKAKSSHQELVEARKKSGWSQKALAEYLGCSVNYLCQMEKGSKPLNLKAQEFVREGIKFPKKKKKKKEIA